MHRCPFFSLLTPRENPEAREPDLIVLCSSQADKQSRVKADLASDGSCKEYAVPYALSRVALLVFAT